jgi:hypothetical protein
MEPQPTPNRLLDQVRDALRLKHYSYRPEQAYVGWITRYVLLAVEEPRPTRRPLRLLPATDDRVSRFEFSLAWQGGASPSINRTLSTAESWVAMAST